MKRIVIIRHAKAVPYGYDYDISRDLRKRGQKDAQLVSEELRNRGIYPDLIISSTALRAKRTSIIFAETFDYNTKNIEAHKSIYDGWTTAQFVEKINQLPEKVETVFFFGHNPNFHQFAFNLAKDFNGPMPTSSTVSITFDVESWDEVKERQGDFELQIIPKNLK